MYIYTTWGTASNRVQVMTRRLMFLNISYFVHLNMYNFLHEYLLRYNMKLIFLRKY